MAGRQGEAGDPVETVKRLIGGVGVDRAVDAVGVDAMHAHHGAAAEVHQAAPEQHTHGVNWVPGDAPSQVPHRAVESLAKAGTLSMAMNKNLSISAGTRSHRAHIPKLVEMLRIGRIDPLQALTGGEPLTDAIAGRQQFDRREGGWTKTELTLAHE